MNAFTGTKNVAKTLAKVIKGRRGDPVSSVTNVRQLMTGSFQALAPLDRVFGIADELFGICSAGISGDTHTQSKYHNLAPHVDQGLITCA